MSAKPLAQGELLFIPVKSIPAKAALVKIDGPHYIVGHSETGHHHVIEKTRAEVYEAADDQFCAWIKTLGGGADVVHLRDFDTHKPAKLEPDTIYEVRRQREWVPEGYRKAMD